MNFFLLYRNGKGYVIYREVLTDDYYDYQDLFSEEFPSDTNSFCELDYRN